MKHLWLLFACCASTALIACGTKSAQPATSPCDEKPNAVLTVPDAHYGSGGGNDRALDLYLPWRKAGEPLILFVHGGGWTGGDKRDYGHVGRWFARCGIAFANVNYPLAPKTRAGAQAAAVLDALDWLARRGPVYGYAADRTFLMGYSAGAQLVSLAALDPAVARKRANVSISGVIALAGLGYRLPGPGAARTLRPDIRRMFAAAFGPDIASWKRFNLFNAHPQKSTPFLVAVGRDDVFVPEADSLEFAQALRRVGGAVAYLRPSDRDHSTIVSAIARDPNDPTGLAIERFVYTGSLTP